MKDRPPSDSTAKMDTADTLLLEASLTPQQAEKLALDASGSLLAGSPPDDDAVRQAVLTLCRIATSDREDIAQAGLRGLFPQLAERLADAFDPLLSPRYERIFSQVIGFCRSLPAGRHIDATLARFGLHSDKDLTGRMEALRNQAPMRLPDTQSCRKCIVLSRVTLGADIAVTSIVVAKFMELFPQAEIILIGDRKCTDIFSGVRRFRVRHCPYPDGGGLLEKIASWTRALSIVDEEIRGLPDSAYLVVDPDSRLTQLGLLPLVENDRNYLFFDSRAFRHPDVEKISLLTSCWLKMHMGGNDLAPFISLSAPARDYARRLRARLTEEKNILIGLSLGVGRNDDKRLGFPFELELLRNLACHPNNTVLLFKGVGPQEIERTTRLLRALRASSGVRIIDVAKRRADHLPAPQGPADIIAWEGELGEYCALIAQCDIQIGYDSSSQHIAGACGVSIVDIFVDESTPMFIKRWPPHGSDRLEIVNTIGSMLSKAPKAVTPALPRK